MPSHLPLLDESAPCIKVTHYDGSPDGLTEAFLRQEDLGLKDIEGIAGGEVAAVHMHTRHLHPNELCVGLQEVPDAQIRVTNKDTVC